jgi:hypothetical protein
VVVVMVTTLITAIGIFAVRNVSQIDQAVGFSRQSGQTNALAELGTTAALAQMSWKPGDYVKGMDSRPCMANGPYSGVPGSTCYRLDQDAFNTATTNNSGALLLEPTIAGTETGSFGPLANAAGFVTVELTEKHQSNGDLGGVDGTPLDVTLTTMAAVAPASGTTNPCGNSVATMSVQKLMRAHVIVPP